MKGVGVLTSEVPLYRTSSSAKLLEEDEGQDPLPLRVCPQRREESSAFECSVQGLGLGCGVKGWGFRV